VWRSNFIGTEDDRPDKIGVIFDSVLDDDLGLIIHAKEIREGSIDKISYLIRPLSLHDLVVLSYCDGRNREVMGPLGRASELSEFLRSKNVAFKI